VLCRRITQSAPTPYRFGGSLRLLTRELEAGHIGFRLGEHELEARADRGEQGLAIGIDRGFKNQLRRAIGAGAEPASTGSFCQVEGQGRAELGTAEVNPCQAAIPDLGKIVRVRRGAMAELAASGLNDFEVLCEPGRFPAGIGIGAKVAPAR
jgi:hypothetical protein